MRINGNDLLFNNFYIPSTKMRISKHNNNGNGIT